MNEEVEFVTMSDREKYLFDLQGYLKIRDFLTMLCTTASP